MKPHLLIVTVAASLIAAPAFARKSCDELKAEIEAKLKDKGVSGYTLEVVGNDAPGDGKVVGGCDGGTKKIVYKRAG